MTHKTLYENYKQKDKELEFITMKMNMICRELESYKKEYYKIMSYYRTQKQRGLITQEEYEKRANMFEFKGIQSNKKI